MKQNNSIFKRILSLFLVVCMLVGLPQIVRMEALAESEFSKVSDPSTMDSWKDLFDPDVYNTENAGVVWTDKSVFTSANAFGKYGITMDNENAFLASLSLIASNKSVTGISTAPTDTMIVLDLSSSMYSSGPETVNTMVNAVNQTLTQLQAMNINNRVGVSIFFGGEELWPVEGEKYNMVLLPIDRYYNANNTFLKTTLNADGSLCSLDVNSGVYKELKSEELKSGGYEAQNPISASHVVKEVAGTYTQRGFLDALHQFTREDLGTTVPMDSSHQPGADRTPILLLMTDGEPTAASNLYSEEDVFRIGNNRILERYPSQTDFLTLLTAAYVKERVDIHYKNTTPLFYTLSLGTSISEDVTNPKEYDIEADKIRKNPSDYTEEQQIKAERNRVVKEHWKYMIKDGGFVFSDIKTYVEGGDYIYATLEGTTVDIPGRGKFPWSEEQRYYVDRAFTAADASDLVEAFGSVVDEIAQQQKYLPTLVEGNQNSDGFVTFTDNIGKYMNVSDVKGIIFGDRLFSGTDLASNFVYGGGNLGTTYYPTDLGIEMVSAVQKRLGISRYADAVQLITKAYNAGQLSYVNSSNYSNYIGWYADANGKYLGFWDGGTQNVPYGAVYTVKSYGYLGTVDDALGLEKSDMMYADVQVRENVQTGEQTVIFAVPASLVPIVNYDITLDRYSQVSKFNILGATSPIRLVYEIELDDAINENTVIDGKTVDSEYVKKNSNADGSVNFYTNAYEVDNSVGYGTSNTISYFRPSHQNESYYFQENSVIYVYNNDEYKEYSGYSRPNTSGEYYYAATVYCGGDFPQVKTVYKKLSEESINAALYGDGGKWYVPKGSVNVMLDGYTVYKSSNPTNTLQDKVGNGLSSVPFVDIKGHGVNDPTHNYVVGATLGNNGRITVTPVSGLKISKTVEGVQGGTDEFVFTISSTRESYGSYAATKTDANGIQTSTTVRFTRGIATVSLKNGESIVITGISAGNTYVITENATDEYVLKSVNGNTSATNAIVTAASGKIVEANFVNAVIEKGNLTVSKVVNHNLGEDYELTHDQSFTINITLTGSNVANKTFSIRHSGNQAMASLTTDSQGKFPAITLKDGEMVSIINIPVGVVATVAESNVPNGFAVSYLENNVSGDGVIAISKGENNVNVVNRYTVEGEEEVVINGTKELIGKDLKDGDFTFELKDKSDGTIISTKNEGKLFSFVLVYTKDDAGKVFEYELYEVNDGAERVEYDTSVYTVKVTVNDDGNGGIITEYVIMKDDAEVSDVKFTNVYTPKPTDITININVDKIVENIGVGEVGPSGFEFVLENVATGKTVSAISDENGKAMFTLAFGEENIGGVYSYKVYEVNGGMEYMTYSDMVYDINITITLGEDNKLYATITNEGEAVSEAVCEFVNIYNQTPPAKPGDTSKTVLWVIVLISSACGFTAAYVYGKKKKEDEE